MSARLTTHDLQVITVTNKYFFIILANY